MARLSVVLPVYNVERYLATCLDSVRSQTFRDLEIICVDDGSTDRSPLLLQMAAVCDPRIRIVTQPNAGLSAARNAGLRAATGDHVLFVDSDDFLDPQACATVVAAFEETSAEVVTFGAWVHPAASATPWLTRTLSPRRVTYDGFEPDLLFDEASRPFVWRSAFTRDFLEREGLQFDTSVMFGEDQVFYFAAYPVSRRTALIPDKLYFYRASRPESLMASRFSDRTTMMTEHHHITLVILELWRQRGWLATYQEHMLEWVFEFLADEAVLGEPDVAPSLRSSMATLLEEYFAPGPWLAGVAPVTRSLHEAFRSGREGDLSGLRAAHLAWQATATPRSLARRVASRVAHTRPARGARRVAARLLPKGDGAPWQGLRDQVEDDARRAEALQLLLLEWQIAAARGREDLPGDRATSR